MISTNYKVIIEKTAAKFIESQTHKQQERLLRSIYSIPNGKIKPLQGFENIYRLRIGDYRIIYRVNNEELVIIVLKIGNRGDVYKWKIRKIQ